MNISSVVEQALKKHLGSALPEMTRNISYGLEFRLVLPLDLSKPFKEAKRDFIRNYLNDLLTLSLGNVSRAAKRAQMHRRHLHRMLQEFEIDPAIQRKEMLKPAEYMKDYVSSVFELNLSDNIKELQSNFEDISEIIVENSVSYDEAQDMFEREYILNALRQNGRDITKTAAAADLSERTLYRKISKLNLAA